MHIPAKETCLPNAQPAGLCPVRDILDRIGDKWSLLVLLHLGLTDTLRFNELRKNVPGLSQRMLTVTLRSLESDGLVVRRVYAQVPPRVEYQLTDLGRSLLVPLGQLQQWAVTHAPRIEQARAAFAQAGTKLSVARKP